MILKEKEKFGEKLQIQIERPQKIYGKPSFKTSTNLEIKAENDV